MHFIVVCLQLQQMNRRELVLAVLLENHSMIYMAAAAEVRQPMCVCYTFLLNG